MQAVIFIHNLPLFIVKSSPENRERPVTIRNIKQYQIEQRLISGNATIAMLKGFRCDCEKTCVESEIVDIPN